MVNLHQRWTETWPRLHNLYRTKQSKMQERLLCVWTDRCNELKQKVVHVNHPAALELILLGKIHTILRLFFYNLHLLISCKILWFTVFRILSLCLFNFLIRVTQSHTRSLFLSILRKSLYEVCLSVLWRSCKLDCLSDLGPFFPEGWGVWKSLQIVHSSQASCWWEWSQTLGHISSGDRCSSVCKGMVRDHLLQVVSRPSLLVSCMFPLNRDYSAQLYRTLSLASCVISLCLNSLIAKLIFMTSFLLLGLLLCPVFSIVLC